ncbi:MAG: DMT family transporter [Flavobacteriaceae bacterium]|nr:DMT family transporter [Flavobacteriaceae bacterium]
MFDLALSVLCSSLIFVIFKLFEVYRIQTLYAIIVNYMVACLTGVLFYAAPIPFDGITDSSWFLGTLGLGVLFILVFNIMAKTSQQAGVSVASVATKMSLVLPVLFGVFIYGEQLSFFKVCGILMALAAVYFASVKEGSPTFSKATLVLPVLVFLGSGAIDTAIKYFQQGHLSEAEFPLFSATVFAAAACTGLVFIMIRAVQQPLKFNGKNILGGIALGVPNYFSIFFLLRALQNDRWPSAAIFTLNNVAIVMCSTLLGIVLFKERMIKSNWIGIVLAVISIILVALF